MIKPFANGEATSTGAISLTNLASPLRGVARGYGGDKSPSQGAETLRVEEEVDCQPMRRLLRRAGPSRSDTSLELQSFRWLTPLSRHGTEFVYY